MLSFTRAQIRVRAQQRADMVNSPLVDTAEWGTYYNEALEQYWTLVDLVSPEQIAAEASFTTTPGVMPYTLPADFRRSLEVYADEGNGQRRPILPVDGFSRARYVAPQGAYSLILRYATNAPVISDDTTAVMLGELGDAYVVRLMAACALQKEASNDAAISTVMAECDNLEKKIKSTRRRDGAFAPKSRNVEMAEAFLYPYAVRIRGYAILGSNIEFYQPLAPYYC